MFIGGGVLGQTLHEKRMVEEVIGVLLCLLGGQIFLRLVIVREIENVHGFIIVELFLILLLTGIDDNRLGW